mmetsp:Transcript_14492/g.16929  ORF Transcript_14492/g.16929 Transcript_14492/m.16929 type:complete len:129 (-) Transcript_14492:518-904(-)
MSSLTRGVLQNVLLRLNDKIENLERSVSETNKNITRLLKRDSIRRKRLRSIEKKLLDVEKKLERTNKKRRTRKTASKNAHQLQKQHLSEQTVEKSKNKDKAKPKKSTDKLCAEEDAEKTEKEDSDLAE